MKANERDSQKAVKEAERIIHQRTTKLEEIKKKKKISEEENKKEVTRKHQEVVNYQHEIVHEEVICQPE